MRSAIRIAAVGDMHISHDSAGRFRPHWGGLDRHAEVLLLAGDLTDTGHPREAEVLVAELRDVPVPVVAVLGNHDHHSDAAQLITHALRAAGVHVLEGDALTLELPGGTLGIAGVKGFPSGFRGACGHKFGEPEMKAFVQAADDAACRLESALGALATDFRVALMHYAPVRDTVEGERPEIYPFLGAHQLGTAVDRAGADVAVHGHAHHGTERGATPGGIPVLNVAMPLTRRPYTLHTLEPRGLAPGVQRSERSV